VEVRVLGPLEVVGDGGVVPVGALMQRRLLAALVIDAGETCSADVLVDALWGESPPSSAAKLLQVYVSQLRKVLPAGARIRTRGAGYVLALDDGSLDAARFERLLAQARDARAAGNPALASSLLGRALALWRGRAYGELAYDDFARAEADRLDELRLIALEERIDAQLALGRHGELLAELGSLAAEHPLRERLQEQAMLALYRCGRQAEALDVYAAVRARLHDDLGLEPGAELRELQRRILQQDAGLAVQPSAAEPLSELPSPPNALVGRERELEELRGLLLREGARLVVLTGAGGSGKTRLALEAARELSGSFANGAALVGLAPLGDPGLVVGAICDRLGIPAVPGQEPLETLAAALRPRELLLVVDNVEHLRAAAPSFVELLARAPHLTLLVTSRTVLHLSGEHVYPLEPLLHEAAVALFLERAREADRSFSPDAANEAAVGRICELLDGLPLAVELAASRIRTLTPVELLDRLDPRLPLLTGGARDLPARQQTLRATLEWSFDLLDEDDQRGLSRLAVFAGGCTLDAAEAVCATTVDRLSSFVDQNLLRRDQTADGSRYSMLQTIRELGLERLGKSGEREATAAAHLDHFLALAEAAEVKGGASTPESLDRLDAERDNFRAAMRWALDEGRPVSALRLASALGRLWVIRAHREGYDWLSEALEAAPDAPPEVRAAGLMWAGSTVFFTGDHERATALGEEALVLFRQLGDKRNVARELDRLAAATALSGDRAKARALADESLALFRETGDRAGSLYPLSKVALDERMSGKRERGVALTTEALELAREVGDWWWAGGLLADLADMAWEDGDLSRAATFSRDSLSLAHVLGDVRGVADGLGLLAVLAAAEGDRARASRLWGAVEALEESGETRLEADARARCEGAILPLSDAELEAARAEGRAMTLDETVQYALDAKGSESRHREDRLTKS
jgi:predicted ATPase/DNA-binding SARP family transcriptional activator